MLAEASKIRKDPPTLKLRRDRRGERIERKVVGAFMF
jgi:hypothetical protein